MKKNNTWKIVLIKSLAAKMPVNQISSESIAKKTNQLNAAPNFLLRHPWLRVYKNSYTRLGAIIIDVTCLPKNKI